jgi:nitrate/TMAO reductase-like tetraheme cytochrome c subunit
MQAFFQNSFHAHHNFINTAIILIKTFALRPGGIFFEVSRFCARFRHHISCTTGAAMAEKRRQYRAACLAFGLFVVLCGVTGYALRATSATEFCMSCHEMTPYLKEQRFSSHAKDKDGKEIGCSQCHIPQGVGPRFLAVKMYSGVKDLAVHVWSKPDSLNRAHAQEVARRFVDDANCLACHADMYKNAKNDAPVSAYGRLAHEAYLGKNGAAKRNCVGCHINLAHLPAFDRRLQVNAAFTSRFPQEEVQQ